MKKYLQNTIVASLIVASAGAGAASMRYQIVVEGFSFEYNPNEVYEEMGVIDQENVTDGYQDLGNYIPTNEAIAENIGKPIIRQDLAYAVLRDPIMNDGVKYSEDKDAADPGSDAVSSEGANGKGDSAFGKKAFGTQVQSMALYQIDESGIPVFLERLNEDLFVDFRLVLEQGQEIVQPDGETVSYGIVETFSYFDLLTKDGEFNWGLALDTENTDGYSIEVTNSTSDNDAVSFKLDGELFLDPSGINTNSLPFASLKEIDSDNPINIDFTFRTTSGTNIEPGTPWGKVTGFGTGNVFVTGAVIPEPATLGLFGVVLTGMSIMRNRRKKNIV